ncbi:MAG: ABC transporter ATP-binding protein [Fuerstiella sp.]
MPLATLSEGLGIALLMPLFSALDQSTGLGGESGGLISRMLAWLPLPATPLALLALIAFAFLMKAGLRFLTIGLQGIMYARLVQRLRTKLTVAFTNLSFPAFASRNTGHYVNLVNEQATGFTRSFVTICQTSVQMAAAVIYFTIAAMAHWKFALFASAAGIVFMVFTRLLMKYVRRLSRTNTVVQSRLNGRLVQVIHALKYLTATARCDEQLQRLEQDFGEHYQCHVRTNVASAFTESVLEPFSVITVLLLIAVQIHFFDQPVGAILVTLILLDRATKSLMAVQRSWQKTQEQTGAVEAVLEELVFVDEHQERCGEHRLNAFRGGIEFQDVLFRYESTAAPVLKAINISVPYKHTIAFIGHSGAGKSTLADLLTLLLRPNEGRILIDGRDTNEIDPSSWRKQIGYVCQQTVVFDDTIAANICFDQCQYDSNPECRRRVHEAAEQAYATQFIESLPEGYGTVVGDRGVRLSGGQCQRLFIARELYRQPNLLILDEATSSLDGESERAIQASIDALRGQMTVVVIAHRLSTIRNADYIYVLDEGSVIEQGPYSELNQTTGSRFRRMVELQSL